MSKLKIGMVIGMMSGCLLSGAVYAAPAIGSLQTLGIGTQEITSEGNKISVSTVQAAAPQPAWSKKISGAERWQSVFEGKAVLDKETGLIWQKVTNGQTSSWADAIWTCYDLSLDGRKGWRLPSLEELTSLVDTTSMKPALPSGHPFTDSPTTLSGQYWSATTHAILPEQAWFIDLKDAHINHKRTTGDSAAHMYSRCVRGVK
ncbi:MAG: DUF1566 domain-containing protein [Desulfuromonadaceae bacterium]|nr:DUF1566 domain-containing protein [Desulfuromonadaceae bacterium]